MGVTFVVVIAGQELENPLENAALGPSVEALIDDLPVAKALGQIAPRDAGAKPEKDSFDEQAIVRRRTAHMAFAAGQNVFDPIVLPFANLSGDPGHEHFVDGVTESLTADLSRIRGAYVVARNTALTYKGEPLTDLFDMQDEIVARLASALNDQLAAAEARRAEKAPTPDSMDLYFQGMAWINKGHSPENVAKAHDCFDRALIADPSNVEALVGSAWADAVEGINLFVTDPSAALGRTSGNGGRKSLM